MFLSARRGARLPYGAHMSSPIAGLSSMATRHLLAELAHAYEKRGGPKADIRAMGGVEAAKLVRAGEPTDVVILAQKVMKALEGEGWLAAGSVKDFTRSEVGLAVPAGAQRPDIRSEGAVKQAMIEAKRICYSTGPSGDHLKALCEKWGLADTVLKRALVAPPGVPVVSLLAKGEADLGFQQISELTGQQGVDVVGSLPAAIQSVTVFSAGVSTKSKQPEKAAAFVAYLASPETAETKRRHGMDQA